MKACFGKKGIFPPFITLNQCVGYLATLVVILALDFGSMVSYMIIIGDTVTPGMLRYVLVHHLSSVQF